MVRIMILYQETLRNHVILFRVVIYIVAWWALSLIDCDKVGTTLPIPKTLLDHFIRF